MRLSQICCLLVMGLGLVSPIQAQEDAIPQPIQIILTDITMITPTESSGDELYFSVTEYSSVERPNHYLVPNFPTHWLSDHLEQIKRVELWSKTLKADESVTVIISLLERDAPPWNVDDLIGTVKFKIHRVDGEVQTEMSLPNLEIAKPFGDVKNEFVLTGDQGEYRIKLEVE